LRQPDLLHRLGGAEIARALLEDVVLGDHPAQRQATAERRDLLGPPAQIDLRLEELGARVAVLVGLVRETHSAQRIGHDRSQPGPMVGLAFASSIHPALARARGASTRYLRGGGKWWTRAKRRSSRRATLD